MFRGWYNELAIDGKETFPYTDNNWSVIYIEGEMKDEDTGIFF